MVCIGTMKKHHQSKVTDNKKIVLNETVSATVFIIIVPNFLHIIPKGYFVFF